MLDREKAAREWDFCGLDYMNHGGYGACPRAVLAYQQRERATFLQNPMEYFMFTYPKVTEENRLFWASFLKADPQGVVHVECATMAVNTVMKSLALRGYFKPGEEILITSHGYNACNNVAHEIATLTGAVVTVADIPFPVEDPQQVTDAVLRAATGKTRLAIIDHITSETGLVFPVADIVKKLKERGVETLVDGAHAPAQVTVDVGAIGAAFYTGNGHKWLCAAPGCAFLYVRDDFRDRIRPLSTSHGANDPNPAVSPFLKNFAWVGSRDAIPWTTPKLAHDTLASFHHGGLAGVMADNHALCAAGYKMFLNALDVTAHAPVNMVGTMASVILPAGDGGKLRAALRARGFVTQLGNVSKHFGEGRFLRICAAPYNTMAQYERMLDALMQELAAEKKAA
jgi:isopenicillin-N epimerase